MQQVIDGIFTFMDMAVLMICTIYIVILLPQDKKISGNKKLLRVLRYAAWLVYAVLTVLIPVLWKNDLVTMIVLSICYSLVGVLLYHRDKTGILYQLGFMFFMYATQMIAPFAATQMWQFFSLEYKAFSYIWILLRVVMLVIVTFVFRMLIRKRYVSVQPYSKMKIRGMLCVPVISILLIFLFTISSDVFLMRFGYEWLIVYCVLVLVMNLYCLYFWYDVSKTQELKHKLELMRQQNELTHQFYADLESNYAKSRKVIHDIRNHLQMLEQSQKFAECQNYVSDVHQMLNALGMAYYTDNRMLNII
ncbi:MAG: ATP-binding protein, partial [Lachnospiraceae bacterium]|nr:ATP-binding protein [Lachnospiraceae bacterium]